jgi:mercuric ion transport protein
VRTVIGSIGAAVAASACCIGPVVFSSFGAGALAASAMKLERYRPWLIGVTVILVGFSLYRAYGESPVTGDCAAGECTPASRRASKAVAWLAALVAATLLAFPYYIGWLV